MLIYILRRLGFIILTMFLASIIIFSVTQLLPGDVAQVVLGQFATETALNNLREELGLNLPLHTQYLNWVTDFVQGDWGTSLTSRLPVRPLIMARLYNSAMLAGVALLIYVPLGILLGVIAALNRDKFIDKTISGIAMAFVGLPEFVTGLLLITFLAIGMGWLPANSSINPESTFREAFYYLILPAITVSLTSIGYIARMTRAGTIDVLRTDYVRAAYLKGLSRGQVLIRHVLRNALLPTVTVVALSIGWLLGGLIVTETVFGYPGMGRLLIYAIQRRDLPLIQAGSMIIVAIYSLSNLGADILYSYLNPRIRVKK
ncbi:MAG: ABC transporter permease [Dehalobacterium sp.]